jgi:hypothetical protein
MKCSCVNTPYEPSNSQDNDVVARGKNTRQIIGESVRFITKVISSLANYMIIWWEMGGKWRYAH